MNVPVTALAGLLCGFPAAAPGLGFWFGVFGFGGLGLGRLLGVVLFGLGRSVASQVQIANDVCVYDDHKRPTTFAWVNSSSEIG